MPSNNRSSGRVLFLWDGSNEECIGGLVDVASLTNKDLLQMIKIVIIESADTVVQFEDGNILSENDDAVKKGNYIVWSENLQINNEPVLTRSLSVLTGPLVSEFRENVQRRDGGCVITKAENALADYDLWHGFEAAHVFPLNYGRGITMVPSVGGKMNSVQNGLLLRRDIHAYFDHYVFSIHVPNGYKVVLFYPDVAGIAGNTLDERLIDDPARPPDYLLEWHFRQAVLTNMRGAGEPIFEDDFPPSSDMMGEIMEGPKAAERLEFEIANRLGAWYGADSPDIEDSGAPSPGSEDAVEGPVEAKAHNYRNKPSEAKGPSMSR